MSHARIPRRPHSREIDSLSSTSSANLNSLQPPASSNFSPSVSLESSNQDRRSSRAANSTLSHSPVPNKRSKSGNLNQSASPSLEAFGFHSVAKRESSFENYYASNMDYNGSNGFRNHASNSGAASTNPKAPPISGTITAGPKRLSIKNAKGTHLILFSRDCIVIPPTSLSARREAERVQQLGHRVAQVGSGGASDPRVSRVRRDCCAIGCGARALPLVRGALSQRGEPVHHEARADALHEAAYAMRGVHHANRVATAQVSDAQHPFASLL